MLFGAMMVARTLRAGDGNYQRYCPPAIFRRWDTRDLTPSRLIVLLTARYADCHHLAGTTGTFKKKRAYAELLLASVIE